MQTLGNLCSAAGFKNVIVDKENFQFNITKKKDPMPEHEKYKEIKNKYEEHFSEKPAK